MPEHDNISTHKKDADISRSNQPKMISPTHRFHPFAAIRRARANPMSLSYTDIIQLQKAVGNSAVCQLLRDVSKEQAKPVQKNEFTGEEQEGLGRTKQVNNTGLPDNLKAGIENLSGMDMSNVRVHTNSSKPAQLEALAYTQGMDIHIAPGQEQHLPHEAWHVVQQSQGRVRSTMQLNGVEVNDDEGLEHEADQMGKKAVQGSDKTTDTIDDSDLTSRKETQIVYNRTLQRVKEEIVHITGITHLVKMKDGSIYERSEEDQLDDGTPIVIDKDDSILSRRGPNQEIYSEIDRVGEQVYLWYRVTKAKGEKKAEPVYVREDATDMEQLQVDSVDDKRQRMSPDKPKPSEIGLRFTRKEIIDETKITKTAQIDKRLSRLIELGYLVDFSNAEEKDLGKKSFRCIAGIESVIEDNIIDKSILNKSLAKIENNIADALMQKEEIFQSWYHEFFNMMTLIVNRRDLSLNAMKKLLKFELMRFQLQGPYKKADIKDIDRQSSPLASEDYARGMMTTLWGFATEMQLQRLFKERGVSKSKFNKECIAVLAYEPFPFSGQTPQEIDLNKVPKVIDRCLFIKDLGIQVFMKTFDSKLLHQYMGGHGQRVSVSESAELLAAEMAKLVKKGNISEAIKLVNISEKEVPKETEPVITGEKEVPNETTTVNSGKKEVPKKTKPVDTGKKEAPKKAKPVDTDDEEVPKKINLETNTMIASKSEDDEEPWRDPIVSSTEDQLNELSVVFGEFTRYSGDSTFMIKNNVKVIVNMVGKDIKNFFNQHTPSTITAGITDTFMQAVECARIYNLWHGTSNIKDGEDNAMMEKFYQQIQIIHEMIRFQLSWKGKDGSGLGDALEMMLPSDAPIKPTGTYVAQHGLTMFDHIKKALPDENSGVMKGSYYETPHIFADKQIDAEDKMEDRSLIVLEPHPNNAENRNVKLTNPLELLDHLEKSDWEGTVVMDVTLNHLGEKEIKDILIKAQDMIKAGRLDLVLLQSGTKFLQHGMDIMSIGTAMVFNNPEFSDLNDKIKTDKSIPTDDAAYMEHMLKSNKDLLKEYLDKIRRNTGLLRSMLKIRLGAKEDALEITESEDPQTVYVAIAPTNQYIKDTYTKPESEETRAKAMKDIFGVLKKELQQLRVVERSSFGFNLTNIGECLTTIRITLGIEEAEFLIQYAEKISSVSKILAKSKKLRTTLV